MRSQCTFLLISRIAAPSLPALAPWWDFSLKGNTIYNSFVGSILITPVQKTDDR